MPLIFAKKRFLNIKKLTKFAFLNQTILSGYLPVTTTNIIQKIQENQRELSRKVCWNVYSVLHVAIFLLICNAISATELSLLQARYSQKHDESLTFVQAMFAEPLFAIDRIS